MFDHTTGEIKEHIQEVAETAQEAASDSIQAGKTSARKLKKQARDSKKEALALLASIKDVLNPEDDTAEEVIQQLKDNFSDWSQSLDKELSQALGIRQSRSPWLSKRSLLALSLAAGAGLLLAHAFSRED